MDVMGGRGKHRKNAQYLKKKEQARIACEGFLWDSKVGMRHSMFQIEECIENDDKALINTKNTTINLSKGGDNFFIAHIEERERY